MLRNLVVVSLLAAGLTACATVSTPVPHRRALTPEQAAAAGPTPVVVSEDLGGVAIAWTAQDSSAAAAGHGLVGALTVAVMDGMANTGPMGRALRLTGELDAVVPSGPIFEDLQRHLETRRGQPGSGPVSLSEVRTNPGSPDQNDAIVLDLEYTLSEDAATLRVTGSASYANSASPYVSRHVAVEGELPGTELTGPSYRNTFVYYSEPLPPIVLTQEIKDILAERVTTIASAPAGRPPVYLEDGYGMYRQHLREAQDDILQIHEVLLLRSNAWRNDDAALLRSEIDAAHAFIARYLVLDINRTENSTMADPLEIVETANGRVVERRGPGIESGAYHSYAMGNDATRPQAWSAPMNFGNTRMISETGSRRHTEEWQRRERERRAARAQR